MNIREQVIDVGMWAEDAPRDPSTDRDAAEVPLRRLEARFGPADFIGLSLYSEEREIYFTRISATAPVAIEATRQQAICVAAYRLASMGSEKGQDRAAAQAPVIEVKKKGR